MISTGLTPAGNRDREEAAYHEGGTLLPDVRVSVHA